MTGNEIVFSGVRSNNLSWYDRAKTAAQNLIACVECFNLIMHAIFKALFGSDGGFEFHTRVFVT